jgi:predicted HAD superfamily Cof-like phosphohydrolase
MSKATVTFEDDGDEVAVHVDFGPGGGQEGSGAHQMAMSAVTNLQREHLNNYERTARWLKACGKESGADVKNTSVQIGCHLEEFCEFLGTLRSDSEGYGKLLERTKADLEWFGSKLKRREVMVYIPTHLRTDALDALCDSEVTGNGVAYMAGFDKPSADQAVLASNEAKLVDGKPVILEGGKIGKPENWKAPDLRGFV